MTTGSIQKLAFTLAMLGGAAFALQGASPQRPAATAGAADAAPIAIRGGRILTVSRGIIENGVVVMEGGKITAVGAAGTAIPRNARVIDATNMTVYPGLIDSNTRLGLTEISLDTTTNDLVEPSDNITPHMRVVDAFHAESELIPVTRVNGITNAVVAPATMNTLSGQTAFIQLAGAHRDDMILVRDQALSLNFTGAQRRRGGGQGPGGGGGGTRFPSTRMGLIAELRQAFLDAQEYARKWADFNRRGQQPQKQPQPAREPRGAGDVQDPPASQSPAADTGGTQAGRSGSDRTTPKRDLKLEALLPYLEGRKPVLLTVDQTTDFNVIMELVREFKLRVIFNGVAHAHGALDQIKATGFPVIFQDIFEIPDDDDRYDRVFRLPAEFQRRGIKFAFATGSAHRVRNLPDMAGYSLGWGLSHEAALRAITLSPAEIWGLADQLGSIDVGKTANIVIANGDPLDVRTNVVRVFIGGREVPMSNRQTQLRDQYWPAAAAPQAPRAERR